MKWYGKYGKNVSRIVKRYEKYGRKLWNDMENTKKRVKIFGKYGRKINWIVIRYGKYGRKLWNDMENTA